MASESAGVRGWLLVLKLVLTAGVGWALWHAFQVAPEGRGIFGEIALFGPYGALAAVALFLGVVFFYCRDLGRTLAAVSPAARKAPPASVWWMFVLPYNFIEDFFIIHNVSASLRAEARRHAGLAGWRRFGEWSGLGWCGAQIVSLVPNLLGSTAGLIALVLWLIHWRLIRRALAVLRNAPASATRPAT